MLHEDQDEAEAENFGLEGRGLIGLKDLTSQLIMYQPNTNSKASKTASWDNFIEHHFTELLGQSNTFHHNWATVKYVL